MIERSDSQQTSCSITIRRGDERIQAANASVTIRPDRGMNASVDLYVRPEELDEETMDEIRRTFAAYLAGELEKADAAGIPVWIPADSE